MSRQKRPPFFSRLLLKVLTRVTVILLIVVLLPLCQPFLTRWLDSWADRSVNRTEVLTEKLSSSSRLETARIYNESVLESSTNAALIGTVRQVRIEYTYEASVGIDLSRVTVTAEGDTITFTLPRPELLSDSLTPTDIRKNDFWYPMSDAALQRLLNDEKARLRQQYLDESLYGGRYWQDTVFAFENTIAAWIHVDGDIQLIYQQEAD